MTTLPDWIPAEAWAGYVEMRKRIKKPMTERAEGLRIKDLEKFRDAGHDVGAVLDQSTANNWTDLYEPKDRRTNEERRASLPQLGKAGQATADNAKAWLLDADGGMPETLEAKRRFATLISGLADYYKSEISRAVLALYWEGLKQFDYPAIEKACWAHTQNPDEAGRWMPRVSDLNKVLQGSNSDQSQIAWAKVDAAVRRIGTYQDVVFDDPIIHRVIADMGGWVQLGSKDEAAWPFVAKEFETRYRGLRMRTEPLQYPPRLIGIAGTHNSEKGMQNAAPPVLIGDQRAAKAVLAGGSETPLLEMRQATDLLQLEK